MYVFDILFNSTADYIISHLSIKSIPAIFSCCGGEKYHPSAHPSTPALWPTRECHMPLHGACARKHLSLHAARWWWNCRRGRGGASFAAAQGLHLLIWAGLLPALLHRHLAGCLRKRGTCQRGSYKWRGYLGFSACVFAFKHKHS